MCIWLSQGAELVSAPCLVASLRHGSSTIRSKSFIMTSQYFEQLRKHPQAPSDRDAYALWLHNKIMSLVQAELLRMIEASDTDYRYAPTMALKRILEHPILQTIDS